MVIKTPSVLIQILPVYRIDKNINNYCRLVWEYEKKRLQILASMNNLILILEWLNRNIALFLFCFPFIFIIWRLIALQYCSGFCHTLTWISRGVTCTPHSDPPSHLPLHLIPLGLPSVPGPSTCLMHPTWAGDLFHHR